MIRSTLYWWHRSSICWRCNNKGLLLTSVFKALGQMKSLLLYSYHRVTEWGNMTPEINPLKACAACLIELSESVFFFFFHVGGDGAKAEIRTLLYPDSWKDSYLSISEYPRWPSLKICGRLCDHSDVQRNQSADDHQTALTSNRIIQVWSLASSVLQSEIFKVFLWRLTARRGPTVIFTVITCGAEIKTSP